MSEPIGGRLPDNITAAAFENPAQKIVREEFEELTTRNRATLDNFDPNDPSAHADIELATSFPEAEQREPILAGVMRTTMLRDLKLSPRISTDGHDPDIKFQYELEAGDIHQIRFVTRADGTRIPVYTMLFKDEEGSYSANIALVSNDMAEKIETGIEKHMVETELDKRLHSEFGIEPEFTKQAHFTPADKEAMLQAYENMQNMDTTDIDLTHLSKSRMKLIKAMLPATQLLKNRRERHLPHLIEQYGEEILTVIKEAGLGDKDSDDLIQSERLLRLSALNKQLKTRRGLVKTAMAGATTAYTTIATGAGAVAGSVLEPIMHQTPLMGAAIGATAAIVIGRERASEYRRRNKAGFSEIHPEKDIRNQLHQEIELAGEYFHLSKRE